MAQPVRIDQRIFLHDGDIAFGAVREVHAHELRIYIENAGEFTVPTSAVHDVHFDKVILDGRKLSKEIHAAIGRVPCRRRRRGSRARRRLIYFSTTVSFGLISQPQVFSVVVQLNVNVAASPAALSSFSEMLRVVGFLVSPFPPCIRLTSHTGFEPSASLDRIAEFQRHIAGDRRIDRVEQRVLLRPGCIARKLEIGLAVHV